ncbi:MAG TPA: PaaI family thioesterase [Anaerolineae bacterium]|nr:PaaI family thioesterase [Anaerolineae bacterium]
MTTERTARLLHMFNDVAPIARTLGMRLSFTAEGNAVVDLPYNPGLDHAAGGVHGGIYATLLDSAGWFTAAAARDEDAWIATAEMSIHFLQPVERRALRAVGRLLKRGKRQDVAEVHLYDETGELVGHATGTFILLSGVAMERPKPTG